MIKPKDFNLGKYIQKLKDSQASSYLIGQDNGLGLKEFFHPAFDRTVKTPKDQQISEFYGRLKDDHQYINEDYKSFLTSLRNLDKKYSETVEIETRVSLAKESINTWSNFVVVTSQSLPEEDYTVREDILIKLKDIFMRFKRRNMQTIGAEEVLPFHNEFCKHHSLDIPMHPKNLAMMLHPHWGYYCKFYKNQFSLEDVINFYQTEYVSSYFRKIGNVFNLLIIRINWETECLP